MGYFAYLYVADLTATKTAIMARTHVYGSHVGEHAYFSFGEGVRPKGLLLYADGAVACDRPLKLLPAYPMIETISDDGETGLFQASFNPKHRDEPVLVHVMLPMNFISRRDCEPFEQPDVPYVSRVADRICATYPTMGPVRLRYQISKIRKDQKLDSFLLEKLFDPKGTQSSGIASVELNLGIFKVRFGKQ